METSVEFIFSPVINYALQQNYVPVIKKFSVTNNSEEDWGNVSVSINADPAFIAPLTYQVGCIKKGTAHDFTYKQPSIFPSFLAEITEKILGNITLVISNDDETLFKQSYNINVLAYDEWGGMAVLPEMLAAFVTPNHPELTKIIRRASEILGKWTGIPSFDAYQSCNPDRVRKQMAAIYEAISELQIVYCAVPASFEEMGQRVRLSDFILANKLANCLDISLLYAACLEAVGLNSLLVIIKGHAFAGGWLVDESFADAVNDDPAQLSKRTADGINEIAIVEATCMNTGSNSTFDDAAKAAEYKLTKTEDFIAFLDIKRIRFAGIRPLPLRVSGANGWQIINDETQSRNTSAPTQLGTVVPVISVDKIEVSKQRLWERKLLDLTLRNNLLNLRLTKSYIQFLSANPVKLEDALANGAEFQILPKPQDWDNPLRSAGIYQSLNSSDPIIDLVQNELTQKRLRTYLSERELTEGLVQLYRTSRTSLEENGANTLYISLGFIKWFETDASEKPLYAPILLVPVEIIRKTAQRGYVIRSRDEDTMMNVTILEKLRQDFGISIGGLETLPTDESGVDVKMVFNIIRHAIMARPRWDVEEQALLGNFSFSKFILWNDIHNNSDKLSKNKIVASLISGKLEWNVVNDEINQDLDSLIKPADVALPISTDSSQLDAILNAGEGKSFVLHGPPGTGKSQTITNIIANALYAGKKVLFVAAKKAALQVVEARLNAIGIAPFCLELHSNKAKKSAIIEQLKKTVETAKKAAPQSYESESQRLYIVRSKLNDYVKALHEKYHFGYSLFESFSNYSQYPNGPTKFTFNHATIEKLTASRITEWNDVVDEMATAGSIIGHPHNHVLSGIYIQQYSQQVKTNIAQLLSVHLQQMKDLKHATIHACSLLKTNVTVQSLEQIEALGKLAGAVASMTNTPTSMLAVDNVEHTVALINEIAVHGRKRDKLRSELLQHFTKDILTIDASQKLKEWKIASSKWFLPRYLQTSKIAKSLIPFSKEAKIGKVQVATLLQSIIDYQEEQQVIDSSRLPTITGTLWRNGDCDWDNLEIVCKGLLMLNSAAATLMGPANTKVWRQIFAKELGDSSNLFLAAHGRVLADLATLIQQSIATSAEVQKISAAVNTITQGSTEIDWIGNAMTQTTRWLANIDLLKDWCTWTTTKEKAISLELNDLVDAYENRQIETDALILEYKKVLYASCAEYIIERTPQLAEFNSLVFEEKIRKFKTLSKIFEQLTRDELFARLSSKVPSFTQEAAQSSEIGILQKTIRNNGRAISIRKLFDSIPNLLPRLSPCMLMSPISVAQYFDTNSVKFDLVIFDEASQIPTCEAVGAIARGANVIVVGDPKQMPPTSFFATNNVDEENIDKEDMESILDDCLAISMPSKHLLWHYRSKHESLIAFSNAKYYNNTLLTFPSIDDIVSKVTSVYVPGYYDKGKTRQNMAEAVAIVDEIIRRLSNAALSHRSIGVVTFSVVQQNLIEDLLNEAFKTNPQAEKIALESEEPLFIKNLENVQGDERDIILFSVCYGPDEYGKLSLNFGPINRDGGWRRLNVAVSRARYEMVVFSTLRSEQIDLNRTASEGVAGLKAFLAFAEKGKASLPVKTETIHVQSGNLEKKIAAAIRKAGYEVHTDIGCSSYKIDMAIVNPKNSTEYLLAILCDGKGYHSARTSRDREIVQDDVLKSLGWEVFKVWSMEWWEAPEKMMGRIIAAIEEAQQQEKKILVRPPVVEVFANNADIVSYETAHTTKEITSQLVYHYCQIETNASASADALLMPSNKSLVSQQILEILNIESPISKGLLYKRILAGWGTARAGARLISYLDTLLQQMNVNQTTHGKNTFLWKKEQDPNKYEYYRIAPNDSEKRDADDLPPEEIANGIKKILEHQISLPKTDLIKETARLFGYARMGTNVEAAMQLGINAAINKGFALVENERIIYNAS